MAEAIKVSSLSNTYWEWVDLQFVLKIGNPFKVAVNPKMEISVDMKIFKWFKTSMKTKTTMIMNLIWYLRRKKKLIKIEVWKGIFKIYYLEIFWYAGNIRSWVLFLGSKCIHWISIMLNLFKVDISLKLGCWSPKNYSKLKKNLLKVIIK